MKIFLVFLLCLLCACSQTPPLENAQVMQENACLRVRLDFLEKQNQALLAEIRNQSKEFSELDLNPASYSASLVTGPGGGLSITSGTTCRNASTASMQGNTYLRMRIASLERLNTRLFEDVKERSHVFSGLAVGVTEKAKVIKESAPVQLWGTTTASGGMNTCAVSSDFDEYSSGKTVHVNSYTRSNGTSVSSYYRSPPGQGSKGRK
jgi:hypothetical protein